MKATHSIRWRLQVWLVTLLGLLLVAFGVTAYHFQHATLMRRVDEGLADRVSALSLEARGRTGEFDGGPPPEFGPRDDFGGPDFRPGIPESMMRPIVFTDYLEELLGEASGYHFAVWRPDGEVRNSGGRASALPQTNSEDTRIRFRTWQGIREAYHFTEMGECILVGQSLAGEQSQLRRSRVQLITVGLAILLLGGGGGWWLMKREIRPVEEMGETARRIAEGDLSGRIAVRDPESELGQLATTLNETFSRLEESFERQKRFAGDASHELRTPLSVLIAETQATLGRERTTEEYRETLEGNLDSARQMKRLVETLLEMARAESGRHSTSDEVDLVEAARKSIAALRGLAGERSVDVHLEAESPVRLKANAANLALVMSNLLENAICHGGRGGQVRVRVWKDGSGSGFEVGDNGPGIRPEDLPHVFERFYRADKARGNAGGHYGLGLAICRSLVEAMGGEIAATSELGEGACFNVRWRDGLS